ncbi:ATP-binding protein [Streptomyces sp. 184]|uniref:ATP-binding protein n=1 Tax=Streptomyces sp. 184 TaxID=1827526 RepID=UPI00389259B6
MPRTTADRTVIRDPSVMTWQWRRHRRCVALARAQARKAVARWGLAGIEEPAALVVSELVTNAVVHARASPGREILTRFIRLDNGVRIEVHDASDERPVPRVPGDDGGFGLLLVDELTDRWGVAERGGIGKCVWAVLTTDGGGE